MTRLVGEIWRSIIAAGAMFGVAKLIREGFDQVGIGSLPGLSGELLAVLIVGSIVYLTAHLALWQIAGRPAGPERLFLNFVSTMSTKLRTKWID